MGRLIDEDELIKGRVENDPVVIAAKSAQTAYDPDKVVEQLKYNVLLYIDKDGEKVLLDDAIEIVKAGGTNDNPD